MEGRGGQRSRDPAVGLEQAVQVDCNLEKQQREGERRQWGGMEGSLRV